MFLLPVLVAVAVFKLLALIAANAFDLEAAPGCAAEIAGEDNSAFEEADEAEADAAAFEEVDATASILYLISQFCTQVKFCTISTLLSLRAKCQIAS